MMLLVQLILCHDIRQHPRHGRRSQKNPRHLHRRRGWKHQRHLRRYNHIHLHHQLLVIMLLLLLLVLKLVAFSQRWAQCSMCLQSRHMLLFVYWSISLCYVSTPTQWVNSWLNVFHSIDLAAVFSSKFSSALQRSYFECIDKASHKKSSYFQLDEPLKSNHISLYNKTWFKGMRM